jgi:hypothetical protein
VPAANIICNTKIKNTNEYVVTIFYGHDFVSSQVYAFIGTAGSALTWHLYGGFTPSGFAAHSHGFDI